MIENVSILLSPSVQSSNPAETRPRFPYRKNKASLQYKSLFDLSFATFRNVPNIKI